MEARALPVSCVPVTGSRHLRATRQAVILNVTPTTSQPNPERTGCGEEFNSPTCSRFNKPSILPNGQTTGWNRGHNVQFLTVPRRPFVQASDNPGFFFLIGVNVIPECKAGYYSDGTNCVMCAGNTIKATAGNAANCATTCDWATEVPNESHSLWSVLQFLPPAYVVRREGNVLIRVCPSICLFTGGYPYPIMLCNISQNSMEQTGGGVPISHHAS